MNKFKVGDLVRVIYKDANNGKPAIVTALAIDGCMLKFDDGRQYYYHNVAIIPAYKWQVEILENIEWT